MRHLRVYARLRANSEVIHHAVFLGEAFGADSSEERVKIHEAFVDGNLAAARVHVARAMRVAIEHGAKGVDVGLLYASRGPGLTELWTEPFQAEYTAKDGSRALVRFRVKDDEIQYVIDVMAK